MTKLEEYLDLERKMLEARAGNVMRLETEILDQMDVVWFELSEEDIAYLNSRPRLT